MAITIDWVTGVVSVPKADTTLTGTDPISGREIRSFDTDQFHVDLRIQEDSLEGRTWPVTHDYNSDATFGGATFAPQFILKNSYTVEFEDGTYRVVFTSTNNNIADYSVVNNVSIQPGNSAGLQTVATGSGVLPSDVTDIRDAVMADNMTEDYPVDGQSGMSISQSLYAITQMLSEFQRTGTSVSIKKRDGTEAFELTLDSATTPTSTTQSS